MCAIMSSSRWESSQRPLFVKSVWMNGYRHAILSKEDPAVKSKSPGASTRSRSAKQTNSARSKTKSKSASEALMIPAVQLLLANVHRLKKQQSRERKFNHPREKLVKSFTLNVISTERLAGKFKKENSESPKTKQAKPSYQCYNSENPEHKLHNERLEHCGASLTERVLLWLDLAGRFTNEMYRNKEEENKSRTRTVRRENRRHATAHPNMLEQKNTACMHQNNDHTFVRRCTKNSNVKHEEEEEEKMENETTGVESFEDFSILKGGQRKLQLRNAIESHREENMVTSQLEVVSVEPSKKSDHSSVKKYSKAYCKRQVHIFMPLVAKRMTECTNSVISESNDSSSVIK